MGTTIQQIRLTLGLRPGLRPGAGSTPKGGVSDPAGRSRLPARALLPWAIVTVLVAVAATALGLFTVWSADPEIVARVNGEAVTRGELQRMVADPLVQRQLQQELGVQKADSKELDRLAVRKLIFRRLVLQEAGRRDFRVTEEDVNRAVADLHRRFKDPEKFPPWLKERGRTTDHSLTPSAPSY